MKGSEDSAISEGPEGDPPAPTANDGAEVKDASGARIGWGTLIKVSAALSAVGGLCLHLVGASTNAHYYRHWGLDPAMFPLATDMTFVQGYETLVNSYAEAIVKVWRDYWLVMLGYGVLCSGTLLVMVGWFIHRQAIVDKVYVEERTRWWLRLGFASILAFALPTVAVPFGALTLLLVLASPLTAAKLHAEQRVERMLHRFEPGCEKATEAKGAKCMRLVRGGEELVHGFAVGSSASHIALFDPSARQVVLVEREGTSVIGVPKPVQAPSGTVR